MANTCEDENWERNDREERDGERERRYLRDDLRRRLINGRPARVLAPMRMLRRPMGGGR